MKKSVISIALCAAMLLSALSVMFVMPVSAANGVDFLAGSVGGNEQTPADTYSIVDGSLVFNATAAGQEVALVVENAANLNEYPYFEGVIESEVPFDIAYYDPNNSKWMFAAGDFCYNFAGNNGASNPINAGTENVKFSLTGAYTWTGAPLPENAVVKSITIIARGAGKITVSKCAMTDGLENFDLNTASYNEADTWDNTVSLLAGADGWTSKTVNESDVTVTAKGESLVFANTAGSWPSAYVNFDTPYVVDAETAAVFADFTVKQATTVYLYLNGKTADLSGYDAVDFVAIAPVGANPEVSTGNYVGTQYLKDILPEGAVDADGKVEISAISVFATGAAGDCVTVNAVDLLYNNAEDEETTTTTTTTSTTTTTTTTTTQLPTVYMNYTVQTVTHQGAVAANEELTFDVTASEAADVNGMSFHVAFDDAKFEFVKAEFKGVLAEIDAAEKKLVNVNADREAVDGVKEIWVTALALTDGTFDTAKDEVILTITLKAKVEITEDTAVELCHPEVTSHESTLGNYVLCAEANNGGVVIEAAAPSIVKGDVTGDGEVKIADAMQVFYHVAGKRILEGDAFTAGDITGDGEVKIADAMKVFYFVAGKTDSL